MDVLRLVRDDDLERLYELAALAGIGLTTLPLDRERLRQRIQHSCRSVAFPPGRPAGESFLFVLEEGGSGPVIGTSAVYTKVGGYLPFWTYRLLEERRESACLGLCRSVSYLIPQRVHDGPSEVGTLFLHPSHRGASRGRLLSLARFLFMAEYRHMFEETTVVEFRGWVDEDGESPFWNAVGRHFIDLPIAEADRLCALDKGFIEELFPHHPVYVPLLPRSAQAVIGRCHDETRPAVRLLESEGFSPYGCVDIFDAGPGMRAHTSQIRTVQQSRRAVLDAAPKAPSQGLERQHLVAAVDSLACFRVVLCPVEELPDGALRLEPAAAAALGVRPGAALRHAPFRAEAKL